MSDTEPTWGARFREGLTTPSLTSIAMASATVMLLAGLSIVSVGPSWLVDGRVKWLAANPADDAAFVTARLYDMESFPEDGVVLIGASSMRESVTSADELSVEISKRVGREVPVTDLIMNGLTLQEASALTAEIDTPSTILLGIGPVNFHYSLDDLVPTLRPPRLGISNGVLDDEITRLGWPAPPKTGWPMIDYTRLYASRLPYIPVNLMIGGTEPTPHHFIGMHPAPDAKGEFGPRLAALKENHELHKEVLVRLVGHARESGHTVVLFEGPWLTDMFGGGPEEQAFFDFWFALRNEVVEELDLPVVTVLDANLEPSDYADPVHLNNLEAMGRVTNVIADQLADQLER